MPPVRLGSIPQTIVSEPVGGAHRDPEATIEATAQRYVTRMREGGPELDFAQDVAMQYEAIQEAVAVGIRLPNVSDDEIKLNVTLKQGATFDPVEFSKWMAEKVMVAMVPRFIEVYEDGFPVTATQKIKVAEIKEITDKTWDRQKAGLKFSARK